MRIYQAEKDAGIDFQMNKAGSSTAFITSKVRVGNIKTYFNGMSIAELAAATETVQTVEELLGQKQPDLALVVAILVSTGWNRNDDIFTPEEVWKAKSSPLHKPINDNHDAEKILGHIVESRVLDKDGNEIDVATTDTPPDQFDIEVAGVLYRAFPELSDRIDEIISKANSGEIFVSMECWFPDFGYGFIDPNTGETKLLERTEATAFLTKHLIIYGGCGKYQGYKIGRVMKDMIFGAQGFVDVPANPESVIKVAANKVAVRDFVTVELNELSKGGVEDVDEKQLKELQVKLEEALASLKSKEEEVAGLQKAAEECSAKNYDGQISVLDKKVAELTETSNKMDELFKESNTKGTDLEKQLKEVTDRAEKGEAELEGIRKTETARERMVKLSEVKKVEDKEATLAELREMTDETFEVVLKYAGEVKSEKVESVESEKKTDASDKEEETGQAEAVLANAKEVKSADFNANEDARKSEAVKWGSMGRLLCGKTNNEDEGGE